VSTAPSRPYHHGNLRAALLERAEETLSERGVRELSLRELARDIGVSHAAPRRHFADKQALLDALAEDGFVRLEQEIHDALAAAAPDFTARLAALAHAYVRFATRHAALLELMFTSKYRPGADRLREAAERTFAAPLALIEEGQAAGEVAAGDPASVAMVAFATLQGLAAMANRGMLEGAALDHVVAEATERLVFGLRPR
jgi:AcrR family transcriptional regulator